MEVQSNKDFYFGSCSACGEGVFGVGQGCQALGNIYHNSCFTCSYCGKKLRGKAFFSRSGQIFCEQDFLYSGVHQSSEICNACGRRTTDVVVQARGWSYHPTCFCCIICKDNMEGKLYTVDTRNQLYCVRDYYRVFSPDCAACRKPILPSEGSRESIRIVSSDTSYHVECYDRVVSLTRLSVS